MSEWLVARLAKFSYTVTWNGEREKNIEKDEDFVEECFSNKLVIFSVEG
jgi:hypothetical protein